MHALKSATAALLLLIVSAAVANAATLTRLSGEVLVNRGSGFIAVTGTVEVSDGDRIIVRSGSQAQLSYPVCNRQLGLQPGSIQAVNTSAACQAAEVSNAGAEAAAFDTTTVLAIGGGALVIGGAVVLLSEDDDPASP